ncbi:hypothetical protein BJ742DRAFT_76325 [Cladochytrium replicatum]|nr:hypothetical protein BJ742DRAFT_76325 [Cladochytrium replicatum]
MLLILSHIVSIVQQIYDSVISTAVGSSLALLSMNPELVNTLSESISTLKDNNDRDRNSSEKLQENINWFNNMLETFESSNNLLHSHTLLHILEDIFSQVEGLCRQLDLQKENLETLHKFLMMSKVKFAETVLESFLVVLDTVNNSSTLSSPFFDLAWRKSSQYSDFKALFQSFVAEFCKLLIEPVFVQAMQIFGQYHLSALKVDRSDSPLSIILSTADVHSLKHHFKAAEKKLSESAQSERKSHETMQILFKPFSISIRDWIQTKLRERLHFADEDVAQWKFTLLQFQYVHFDALVHKSECLENMAAPFRSQLVENIQGFMSQLESLKMNMTSLEKSNSSFKQTLVSMHSAEANNVSVSNIQIVRILELADVRQLHLQRDKQRYILDILNAFNHFELSRIPDSPLNMIFTDIIVLIRQLSALESDRQQLILRATSNTSKSTEVTKDGEIDAMTATLGEHLQRFKGYKSQLEKYIQNVASCAQATSQSKHISAEVTNFRQLCSTLDSIVTNVSKITPEKIDATPELLQNIVKSIISFTAPELKRNKLLSQAQEDISSYRCVQ